MVILVRCRNGICTVALESCLTELIGNGLVSAFLRDGEWVAAVPPAVVREHPVAAFFPDRYPAPAPF